MKKFLLGTVGLMALGMAAPAVAADMAVKAAPVPYVAPMYNWSGFYIGVNGGWGSSRNRYEWTGPAGVTALGYSADATGGMFGGQIGYNMQAGAWVFGLEAQYDWADLNKAYYGPLVNTWSVGTKVDAIGLFTGRIGYAANNALFYVKGGWAVANNNAWAAWNNVNSPRHPVRARAVPLALAWNTALARTGRSEPNTCMLGWATTTTLGATPTS